MKVKNFVYGAFYLDKIEKAEKDINEFIKDKKIIWENTYKGRRLIVKQMSASFMDWYCGYVQLHHDDLKKLGDPVTPDDLILNPVFQHFYGEVTFMGYLGAPFGEKPVVGLDTAHPGMKDVTLDDCIEALTKTVDRLEKTIHGSIATNK